MYVVMMTKEGSSKIITIMAPGAAVLVLGCGHMSYSEYVLSSTPSIYSTLIAIVLRDFYTILDFHLFYDGAVDIQI